MKPLFRFARRAALQAATTFKNHPDVTSVGVGETYSKGKPTDQLAVVFLVERKGYSKGSILPRQISFEGQILATDVQEVRRKEFATANSHVDGSDLLISSSVRRSGTLGVVVREDGGRNRVFGITNAHVVSRPNENHVGDPIDAVINGVRQSIGKVAFQSDYRTGVQNKVDLALVELNGIGSEMAIPNKIQPFSRFVVGSGHLSASKYGGARRAHTYAGSTLNSRDIVNCGMVSEHPRVILRDKGKTPIHFGRTFVFTSISQSVALGHSGSVLVRDGRDGLVVAGLLAGGGKNSAFVFSFVDIHKQIAKWGIRLK